MGNFASVYVLFNGTNGTYVGDGNNVQINVNCDRMFSYSPRQCWLKRSTMPGDGTQIRYIVTFNPSDPEFDQNTLQGYMIENEGQDVMIDIINWQALITACNCPDCTDSTGNLVARYYVYGQTPFSPLTANWFCVQRADDGSGYSHAKFVTDYAMNYIGNVRLKSNNSGVSIYTFQSFYSLLQLTAQGTDVITQC
jgi:hypothetical protein